ncbi:Na+/H+ - glutamate/aspartate symport protein [gamma proteobacterium HTCC5015]|nr:Na+/H+ - glutamate/aspartate symport protein [gamma proteobacterium HTCC5015]
MPSTKGQSQLTVAIFLAMIIGATLGSVANAFIESEHWIQQFVIGGALGTLGSLFVSALKMLVVPLVFVSLVHGVTALGEVSKLGRIGSKTIALYLVTTALAISIALALATFIEPGAGDFQQPSTTFDANNAPALGEVISGLIPSNPIAAMAEGNMLQIIVFAIILGLAILKVGDSAQMLRSFFESANGVMMEMVNLVMATAPVGVFCLITETFATEGFDVIFQLGAYFLTVILALLLHFAVSYGLIMQLLARINPFWAFKRMLSTIGFAFSTASSNATIPVTLKTLEQRFGVQPQIASFTVPLGATINMDGTAIMQGVATVFIASVYGINLEMADLITVVLTATLASIGTAGIPSVGLVTLAMVLQQVSLPVEGIALIIGVDRLLDMLRTAVNVSGDATVSCVVARSENAIAPPPKEHKQRETG